ncbi:hypothetical protein M413DRAFT_137769 [Hebeloma cylindrosporum]|uniref:Uncharacterized protein n=1 Tax=Hebeloma cylindrosporum TaxID=76867 RepID=A0A0C3CDU4_HEBCY|nr:hypothetical protein M413DRAFT_137769 [Hebeloma cylindrosporum h7]
MMGTKGKKRDREFGVIKPRGVRPGWKKLIIVGRTNCTIIDVALSHTIMTKKPSLKSFSIGKFHQSLNVCRLD